MNYLAIDPMNFISGSGISALSLVAPSGTRILNAVDLPGCDIVYDNESGWIGYLGVISSSVLGSISTANIPQKVAKEFIAADKRKKGKK